MKHAASICLETSRHSSGDAWACFPAKTFICALFSVLYNLCRRIWRFLGIGAIIFPSSIFAQSPLLRLWYDKPAQRWEKTIPLGNGRIGMMPDGGIEKEIIVLNDITLWSGAPQDAVKDDAYKSLDAIRKLLADGKNDEAQGLMNKNFVCKGAGSGGGASANLPFGAYETLGSLKIVYSYNGITGNVKATSYKRELSLKTALASAQFVVNHVQYTREYFTSFGDDLGVIRISANKRGHINCRISLSRPERFVTVASKGELQMSGQLNNGTDGKGMRYMTRVKATAKDGTIRAEQNELVISQASDVVLYLSTATDFKNSPVESTTDKIFQAAEKLTYAAQKKYHQTNYQKLFNRVSLSIGNTNAENIATDLRLGEFQNKPNSDHSMATLFYQFLPYLSINNTPPKLLPPNLQGLWANQVQPPWNGDYHLDMNIEMNHWPAEVSNLSELNLPLSELTAGLAPQGRRTAKAYYNADGWVAHVFTNVWGFTEPGEDASWGATNAGSGWLCNNLWEHYLFSQDLTYLKKIYPVLRGAAQFYNSVLMRDQKTSWLVTAPSVSRENWFFLPNGKTASVCMGPTIDNQITRELFTNFITASEALNEDKEFREILKTKLGELPPSGRISSDGRLMEWFEEYKEVDPQHRHVSHLYGLYPGSLLLPEADSKLAEACRKTLEVRGDDGPGWSIAHKMLLWATLKDGNRAYSLLKKLLRPVTDTSINYGPGGGSYGNLLSAGPPFQIDGNFGGAAGVAEMLLQSHAGFIELLPALPDAWKACGEAKGLRARGNFTVSFKWQDGRVTNYAIASPSARMAKVKINGEFKSITTEKL